MIKKSIWFDNYDESNYEVLDEDITCDVLIIGGGITGISTLYNLRKSNLNIILVDASLIAHGVSGNTTGKITYMQELIYRDIKNKYGFNISKLYYESQIEAINKIKEIITKEKINCDFENVISCIYTDKKEDVEKLKEEKELLESFGANIIEDNNKSDYLNNIYSIKAYDTYVFHPIKYLVKLKEICLNNNKKIYENTKIIKIIKENTYLNCFTDKHKIQAKKVVLACHYPYFLLPYFMPLKASIEKSYITASRQKHDNKTFITSSKPTTSIRYHKDYLIYLNNSSNICNNINEKQNYNSNIESIEKLKLKPEYLWKNDDLITIDHIPYIGYLKKNDNNLLIATGYNTWGMTNGTLAGIILNDLILNKDNKYLSMCNPMRVNNIKNTKEFIINSLSSAKGYIETKINKNKKFYNSNVIFKNIDGENVAIYKDGNKEYMVYNKCPHLGCSLIFNEIDKTWDCPCHASRFKVDGKCLKGPSLKSITYIKKSQN